MTKTTDAAGGDQRSMKESRDAPRREQGREDEVATTAASGTSKEDHRQKRVLGDDETPAKDSRPDQSQKPSPKTTEVRTEGKSSLDYTLEGNETPETDRKMPPNRLGDDASEEKTNINGPAEQKESSNVSEMLLFGLEQVKAQEMPDFVKQNDNNLTFPEKLVLMLASIERTIAKGANHQQSDEEWSSIGWTRDGTGIVVRDKEHLTSTWLPRFFLGQAKFSSFVRKLYRWGFQKTNPGIDSELGNGKGGNRFVLFENENFRRDRLGLLCNMKSVTAAKIRSESSSTGSRRHSKGKANRKKRDGYTPSTESPTTKRHKQQVGDGSFAATGSSEFAAIPPQPSQTGISPQLSSYGTMGGWGQQQGVASVASVAAQNALLQSVAGWGNLPQIAPTTASGVGFHGQEAHLSSLTPGETPTSHNLQSITGAGLPFYPSSTLSDRLLAEQSITNALQQQVRRQSLALDDTRASTLVEQQAALQLQQDRSERERLVAVANLLLNENRRQSQEEEHRHDQARHRRDGAN